jgi:hypothetical protein
VLPAGSFAAAVTALSPWGYWRLDDNVTAGNPTIYDYWGYNNGEAVDLNTPAFGAGAATYLGFPQPHLGITVGNNASNAACKVNLPKLPVWTNTMTFVMWVTNGGAQILDHNGYGNQYGLHNSSGELLFDWGGISEWDSGLVLPPNAGWAFVALVVQPDQATIYLGVDNGALVASGSGPGSLSISDSDTLGDTAGLYPLGLGRNQWPFSEDGGGAGYNTMSGTWSDVAIFYQSLSASSITNLYLSGVGQAIYAAPDGLGNLTMNWNPAFTLQQADLVTGPWTDVGGSPTPPYSVPMTSSNKFYRVRQ